MLNAVVLALALATAPALSLPLTSTTSGASVIPPTPGMMEGGAIAFGDFTYPIDDGAAVHLRRYHLDVGDVVDWGSEPGTVLGMVQAGRLSNYLGCSQAQLWRPPVGYYLPRSEAAGTLGGVTVNDGEEHATILALVSDTVGAPQRDDQIHRHGTEEVDPPRAVEGCPAGPAAEVEELGAARMTEAAAFDQTDHNQIAVYRYTLAPGSHSGWHELPDPGFVIQATGTTTVWAGCEDKTSLAPGRAYPHDAGTGPRLVSNPGTGEAEYYLVTFEVPAEHPIDVPRAVPAAPPAGCPQSTFGS